MGVTNSVTDSIVQPDVVDDATAGHDLFLTDTDG